VKALPDFWATASQGQRDAAYNNAEAVADSPALIAARDEAAAAFRAAHPGHLDLPYGSRDREAWDLFPGRDPQTPCLVFIHGGYWQRNKRQDFCHLAEGVLALGWSAAFCGYTLAPEASLTTICWQVNAALDWLSAEGASHGIAGPIIASGWSAGGHLTAMALEHPAVSAGLAISGVFDLEAIRQTYLDAALTLTEAEVQNLSPARRPVVMKPLAIAYGARELPELVRHSRDFHALRSDAQAPGPLVPIPGADHFRVLEALRVPGGSLVRIAQSLLD
jgi:acetyl esterase/lipase